MDDDTEATSSIYVVNENKNHLLFFELKTDRAETLVKRPTTAITCKIKIQSSFIMALFANQKIVHPICLLHCIFLFAKNNLDFVKTSHLPIPLYTISTHLIKTSVNPYLHVLPLRFMLSKRNTCHHGYSSTLSTCSVLLGQQPESDPWPSPHPRECR